MRYTEFESRVDEERLDEIGALISMKNWFSQKYHDVISAGARKMGEGEVQKFTNQHLKTFMQMMGRYRQDWPTVTMYVVYQYLRLIMKLNDSDILDVINTTMKDPKVRTKKPLVLQQVRDPNKNTLPSSFSQTGGDPAKTNQLITQMIIAAAAVRQMERHWERQAGASELPAKDYSQAPSSAPARGKSGQAAPARTPQTGTQQQSTQPQISAINAALAQLGANP
jgi:hypothetical protein